MTARRESSSTKGGSMLDGERQVLELIATGGELPAVLDALCLAIDEQTGMRSSVYLLDRDGEQLTFAAGPHIPEEWRQATRSFAATPTSGACGAAVSARDQVIAADLATSALFAPLRDAARGAGVAALWSTPLSSKDGKTLGTFAVVSHEARRPDDEELGLIGRAAYLASIAIERQQAEEVLRQSEALLRVVLDTLPVGVAVTNSAGDVLLINPASQRIWSGVIQSGPERYAKSRGWWPDTGIAVEPDRWGSARALARGESSANEVVEIEAFDGVRKIILNSAVPIRDQSGRITGAVVVNEDVSARKTAERELQDSLTQMRSLTGSLMRAQDDERRRIAAVLHETTAQDLAAVKMYLARVLRTEAAALSEDARAALAESVELAERTMAGTRTLSYLLHPPFLDEAGLLSALRWYAAGFAERSGIAVDLDLPSTFERLPQDVETALFRVVQEALINIHRHAASPSAVIRFRSDQGFLTLEIEDRGRGMSPELIAQLPIGGGALGVGVAGMRERLQQLGGTLDIESTDRGTVVRAHLPLLPDNP